MNLAETVFGVLWVIGIIIAQGFWQTFFAIVIFPYSWYIAVERILTYFGWLGL